MSKKYLVGLIAILIIGAIAFNTLQGEKETEPKKAEKVSFPFSWIEHDNSINIEITVVNITALGTGNLKRIGLWGVKAEEGYQFYGVYVTFNNLGHEKFDFPMSGVGAYLELKTNRENIYEAYGGSYIRLYDLKPEEKDGTWAIYEIQVDEKPVELRNYEWIGEERYIAYIWKIED